MDGFVKLINSYLPEPQASLLNGILFGVRTHMDRGFYQALITTGTLHIIALSGMNITILVNLIAKITLFLGRRWSCFITIIFIGLFVKMGGTNSTTNPAAPNGKFSLFAIIFFYNFFFFL